MANPTMYVHELSPRSIVVDFHDTAASMADPNTASGSLLQQSLAALGTEAVYLSTMSEFGQMQISGSVAALHANAAHLLENSEGIVLRAAQLSEPEHIEQTQTRFSSALATFMHGMVVYDENTRFKDAVMDLLNPIVSDGSEPYGYLRPVIIDVNAGQDNKPQIMRLLKPNKVA